MNKDYYNKLIEEEIEYLLEKEEDLCREITEIYDLKGRLIVRIDPCKE